MIDNPQSVSEKVQELIDNGGINGTRGDTIIGLLDQISEPVVPSGFAIEIEAEVQTLSSKITHLQNILDEAETAATDGKEVDTRTALNKCINKVRDFERERRTIVIAKKAQILRLLQEIRGLLRSTGPLSDPVAVTPADATFRPGALITLGREVTAMRVEVYAMDGKLLFAQEVQGHRWRLTGQDSHGRALANGVYLYVVSVRGPDGKISRTELQVLILKR